MHIGKGSRYFGIAALALMAAPALSNAQSWDVPGRGAALVSSQTESKLKIGAEVRGRYESRTGQAFGKDPDLETGLFRQRLSLTFKPVSWLKFSGMVQDARAPWYGPKAPSSVRDPADLHEAYFELFPDRKTGFGMTAGRMMVNYGEARLIGSPQWGNLSRSYDHARAYWRSADANVEFLILSPVKVRLGEFNRPVLGDRIWGVYNQFPNLYKKAQLDIYLLRRDQNRPGGFTGGSKAAGTDSQGVNTFGARFAGPLPRAAKFSVEGAVQTGSIGPAKHRGAALVGWLSRRWMLGKRTLDVLGEYKYASGTGNPQNTSRVTTFDHLYASNHDRFGHMDLFGWRNIHNARSLATLGIAKNVAVNLMYSSWWLASARDALYNGSGKAIVRSASGAAGRHVGQEVDLFMTYKYKRFTLGAGYGHMFQGGFVRKTTPGVSPAYAYVFHTYTL